MGAVLHLVWRNVIKQEKNATKDFLIDVDFVIPLPPVRGSQADGAYSVGLTETHLRKEKPVG